MTRLTCVALAAALLTACSTSGLVNPGFAFEVSSAITLRILNADNRGASVAASGRRVVVVWAATTGDSTNIHAAVSEDGGATFGDPVRVNDIEGDARVNGEQPPRVAVGRDVDVIWESRRGGTSQVRFSRSTDGGHRFQPAISIHDTTLTGARGWSSVVLDQSGVAHVAWLDGRNAAPMEHKGAPAGAGASEHKGSMRQDIFHVLLKPDGTRVESSVATDVCFCCKTSVAVAANGATYVAWRHIYPVNLRDMAVAGSTDGGKTFSAPVRVSEDGWQLEGCPEDGPSMAVDDAGVVHIAWPTIAEPGGSRKAVFYSYSTDGARTFAPRVRIDEGESVKNAAHPQLIVVPGKAAEVVVTWDESEASGPRARLRLIQNSGAAATWRPQLTPAVTVSDREPVTYPSIAPVPDGLVAAWTTSTSSGSEIHVRHLRSK